MSLVYHILDKVPAVNQSEMQIEYEGLAKALCDSGRIRIDTDYYCNFVRYSDNSAGISLMFSVDELEDTELVELTKHTLKKLYSRKNSSSVNDQKIDSIISNLKQQCKKLMLVSDDLKMRLARILVQSAHPIVIRWILLERAQVFITYGYNIGDVMDMSTWKTSGQNSGMQSTDGSNACIYVSCGGDPFAENDKDHPDRGDGWAAVARMQIIAGQEIGHFADIKRDENGRQYTRHAADFACTKATPKAASGRLNDIKRCDHLLSQLLSFGMTELLDIETQLKFYDTNKVSSLKTFILRLRSKYYRYKLVKTAIKHKLFFVKKFTRDKYMALMIKLMIADMKANLTPMADVYKRSNKDAEEAIACVEALARVPQQVIKWGYLTTKETMHDLYDLYYHEVIPSLIANYEKITNSHYQREYKYYKKSFWRSLFAKKEDQVKLVETRAI
jgi:hypothetical protein